VKETPKGKGGNFNTQRNPFQQGIKAVPNRPSLAECPRLGLAIDRILASGCALILGATRDGGAVCLTILDGEDRHRTYCSTELELDSAIASIEQLYE